MPDALKVGDVVKLKFSFGPMTITGITRLNGRDQAACVWMDGPIRKTDYYDLDDLEKTDKPVQLRRTRMIMPEDWPSSADPEKDGNDRDH